jgi:hypothetical protein
MSLCQTVANEKVSGCGGLRRQEVYNLLLQDQSNCQKMTQRQRGGLLNPPNFQPNKKVMVLTTCTSSTIEYQNSLNTVAAVFFVCCVLVFTTVIFAKLNSPTRNCMILL